MKIILKFLLRNIKEKKLRTFLIILSITLATALLFSTLAMSGTAKQIIVKQLTKYTGTSEIVVQKDLQSVENPFFSVKNIPELEEETEYMIGVVRGYASYPEDDELDIYLAGYYLEDLIKMNEVSFNDVNENSFEGNKVIIGSNAAKDLGLDIGDTITLEINQQLKQFEIYNLTESTGLFNFNGKMMTVIVPRETLANIYQAPGQVNRIYVKSNETTEVSVVIEQLSNHYPDYVVKTTITENVINQNTQSLTSSFSFMLILVIFISIYIIYTSFKVITTERLPMVGTFRSIGATKKMTDIILLGETIIYGVVGGILGSVLGLGILLLMTQQIAYNPYTGITQHTELIYGAEHFIIAFLFALFLSIISAVMPIVRVGKIPVRNIVLNNIRQVVKKNNSKAFVGILLLVIPLLILTFAKMNSLLIGALCIISIAIAIILLVPYITRFFIFLFEYINIFGNIGILAAKNLKNRKNIINNVILLTIGIAGLLMINTVTKSVATEVNNIFNKARFDFNFITLQADENTISRLENIDGIKDVFGIYTQQNVKVEEKNDYINWVWGVNPDKYFDYWDLQLIGNETELKNQLSDESKRNVIISTVIRDNFNLEVGDSITLALKDGNKEYTIIGFTSELLNNGEFILVNEQNLVNDSSIRYLSEIMIKTSDEPNEVAERIKGEFGSEGYQIVDMEEQEKNNIENNNQLFSILNAFSIITLIIGIFGIFNNFVVSLISRRRSIAMYFSVGMSRTQLLKMMFIESIITGFIGGTMGVGGGFVFIQVATYIMKSTFIPITIDYSLILFIIGFISGIVISVVSAIIPTIRSSKLNVIEAIKYE